VRQFLSLLIALVIFAVGALPSKAQRIDTTFLMNSQGSVEFSISVLTREHISLDASSGKHSTNSSTVMELLRGSLNWPSTNGDTLRMSSSNTFQIVAPDETGNVQGVAWKKVVLDIDTVLGIIRTLEWDSESSGSTPDYTYTYTTVVSNSTIVFTDVPFTIDSLGDLNISLTGPEVIAHLTELNSDREYMFSHYSRDPTVETDDYADRLFDLDTAGISTLRLTISPKALAVYLASPATNSLNIFPNPTSNSFNFSYPITSQQVRVQLIDLLGRLRAEYTLPANTSHAMLPTSLLEPGYYMLSGTVGRAKLVIAR
jgi:hypothetical protein